MAVAFPSEAHARSAGGDGWYVKPWNSFQSVPETPDMVPGYERVHVCRRTNYTISLFTTLRDRTTGTAAYVQASSKLAELLLNEALALLPFAPTSVVTPVDEATYLGMTMPDPETELCVVSILRAADSIAEVAMRMLPGVAVGKMLIQRDEETARAKLTYTKFPTDIAARKVLLVDPMLATGGSLVQAVGALREAGVPEQAIVIASLVAAPEGIEQVTKAHPMVRIVVGEVDRGLNARKYIVPGLGDMGDRYYNTSHTQAQRAT